MPSNKIQYVLGIQADTSQAKKSIQELQNALNEITTANSKKLGLDIDLNNAAKAAQQLQQSIQSAVNVDTGRLNFTAFNKSLMQSNTNLNQLITQLRSTGGLGNQAVSQLARSLSTAEIPVKRMTGLLGNFATTLANSFKWQISSNIIHGMQSALSSAVGYAQDLNETLNNIRIVTGQSVDDMAKFAVSANQAAKELSTTTKEFANASLIYYQQGDSAELAAKKAATTVKAANVAFTASAKEMSEMLTAVWNSYQVGEDQLEHVVDVMAKLGATTASSMEEMATAMQKVASTANTVGVSMQQMSAIVATSASVTRQAPETVGTAWNTILSRIGGLKLGETLEDGVDLNKYSNALRIVGVNILDATGNLRDMGGVIDELGAKWQTLNKGQKAALAQTIGGARQYTQIMAFFENFDKYQKNIITAQNSAGALQEQQEIYAQGWEAASKRSRAALEELWNVLIDDEAIISFTNGMTKMTEGVTGLVKAFGGLPGILATISTLMTRTFSNQIATNIGKAVGNVTGFIGSFKSFGGDYTVKQFLTGQMPNAQNRALIENLNAVSGELNRTATGWDINKDNPYAALIMDNANQQANFLQQRIDILKSGQTIPANLNLQYAGYANANPLFNQAYQSFNTTDNVAGIAYKDIVSSGQGRMLFRELNNELFRELIDQTELEAQNAGGADTQSVYQQRIQALSQFIDPNFEKRENYADIIARYQRSARDGFLSKDLDEKTIEAIGHEILSNGGKIREGINSQYILPQDLKNAELEQMGRTAAQAAQGLTSAAMGFNQMNAAMQAFNAGNVTQGLTSLAIPLANVVQMAASGNKVGAAIAGIGSVLGIVTGLIQNYEQKIAEEVKKSVDKVTESVNSISEKSSTILTTAESYNNLNSAWQAGTITIDEYHSALLDTANALEVQGANVLALAGNYEELDAKVQSAIKSQLHQQELNANATIREAEANMGNLAYDALEGNGFRSFVNRKDNNMSQFIAGTTLESINFLLEQSGYSQSATELLGLNSSNGLDLTIENLRKFISGYALIQDLVKNIPSDELSFYDSNIGTFADGYLNAFKGLIESVNPAETAIYNNHGTAWLNKNFTSAIDYDSKQRTSLTEQFLEAEGLTDTDPIYNVAKQAFESLLDAAVAGMVDGGQLKSETAATAAAKQEDWRNRLKRAGYSEDQINNWMQRNTGSWTKDIQWINSPEFEQVFAGVTGSTTAVSQMRSAQSLLSSWYSRDKNFNLDNLASIIFSSPELSSQFMSQKDWNTSSTDDKYNALLKFIDFIDDHQNEWIKEANQEQLNINTQRDNELKALSGELDKEFHLTLNDLKELTQVDIDEYNTLKNKTEPLTETEQASIDRVEQFGGAEAAQAMLYRYQGLEQLSVDKFDVTKKKINDIVAETNTLMNMDLSSSKWGESFQYIVSLLKENGKSFSDWLGMSDLEKQQFQLEVIRKNIDDIHKLQESGEKIDENQLLQLEYKAQQLQSTFNELTLKSLQEQINAVNQEWEDMQGHAEKVMDLISSHQGKGFQSFSDIEALRQSLLGAGIEGERVASIIKEIQDLGNDGKTDDKDAWAGVGAATAAALVSVSADQQKNKGYEGLVDTATVKQLDFSGATFVPEKVDVPAQAPTVDTTNTQQTGIEPQVKTTAEEVKTSSETPITGTKPSIDSIVADAIEATVSQENIDHSNIDVINADSINAKVEQGKISYNDIDTLQVKKVDAAGENVDYQLKDDAKLKVALLYAGEGIEVEGLEDKTFSLETVLSILPETTKNGESTDFIKEWLKENYPDGVKFDAQGNITGFDTNSEEATAAATAANEALKGKLTTAIQTKYDAPSNPEFLDTLKDINGNIKLVYESIQDTNGILAKAIEPGVKPIEVKYTIGPDAYKVWSEMQIANANGNFYTPEQTLQNLKDKSLNKNGISYAFAGLFAEPIFQNLSADSFNGENPVANMIAEITAEALASEDSDVRYFGRMLMAGLATSLGDAVKTVNWEGILSGLGPEIYNAFATELETHSPSRLTWVFGQFLISGVQGGLSEAIQNYPPDVSGLGAKIFAAFQNELKDGKIEDEIRHQAAEYADSFGDYGTYQDWDKKYQEKYNELWNNKAQTFERDYLAGGYLEDTNLSNEEKVALGAAIDTALTKAGKKSLDEVDDKLFDSIQQEINKLYTNNVNSIKQTVAQMKDIWKGALDQVYENEQEAAQKTYDIWEKTFQSIAKARKALLNGQSISDAMGTDAGDMTNMLRLLMKEHNLTREQAIAFINDPNASLSMLDYDTYNGKTKEEYWSTGGREYFTQEMLDPNRKWNIDEQWESYQNERLRQTREDLYGENGIQTLRDTFDNLLSIVNNSDASSEEQSAALSQLQMFDRYRAFKLQQDQQGKYSYDLTDIGARGMLHSLIGDDEAIAMFAKGRGFQDKTEMEEGYFEGAGQDLANTNKISNQVWEEQANLINSNTKELKEYAQALLEVNGDTRKLNELSQEEQKQMAGVAAKAKMAQEGWTSLATKQKDALKTIAKGQQNDLKYVDSLQSVANDVKKIFGNSKAATADFVKDHIKDIQKMANGDTKAAERVERALLESQAQLENWGSNLHDTNGSGGIQDELNGIIDQLNSFGDKYADMPIGFEVTANTDPALQAFDSLLQSGQMTAEQITAALNTIGWEPEIVYQEALVEDKQGMGVGGQIVTNINGQQVIGTIEGYEEGTGLARISYPTLKSAKKTGGGASGSKPPKSNGGGGGGKQHKKKDPIRPQDEIERYHEIRDQIEKLGNVLDKVDKIKTKAFGQKHLDALKEEIALLKQENGLQQEYYAEAARYLAADRADLMHYGAATFNADGTVNYEEYMQNIIAEVNRRFAASESDEEDKAAQQWYDDAKKALENYEEALDLVDTTQNDILKNLNEISALTLEAAQYRLEIRVDLNDSDIKILDYYISKWKKMLSQQDESMEASIGQVYKYEDSLSALGDTFSELIYAHNMGDLNDLDFVKGLKDVRDQVFKTLGSINDLQNTIAEWYGQTLDKAEKELDKYTSKISHSRDVMQTYIEMQQLMGKGVDYRALQNMYTFAYESSLENAKAAREYVDILKEAREVILQQAEEYGWTDTLKQQFDDIEAHIFEAENTLLKNTQQTLEDAKAEFENTMSAIIKEVDNAFTALKDANGDLKKSFSEVADEYSFWTEQQGWYVSTAKELYEVSKINRKIEDSIAGATTQQSKERLKLLQEEINAYAEKNRLTEYDIKMNELQYQMALAMQGLEDAGNSKQTVRLTRDENGNYGYQYTADQDEMDAARQKYEDVLQQINELSDEYQKEVAQKWIDAEQQFWEKVHEIALDTTHTIEENQQRIAELKEQHLQTMQYLQSEYNKSSEQLLTNQGYIQEHYGETIIANTGMVQDQLNATIGQMIGDTDRYTTYINEQAFPSIETAMGIYKDDLDATKEATNLSWEQMGESVQAYRGINQLARQDIQNTDQVLRNTLSGISNATAKWLEHSNSLRTTITSYESLGNSINGIISRLNSVTSAANTAAAAIRNMQSASYSSSSSRSSSSSSGPGGSNNSGPGSNKPSSDNYTVSYTTGGKTVTTYSGSDKAKASSAYSALSNNYGNGKYFTAKKSGFATGGMNDVTGWHWLDGTLQRPELVLNADDTQNMLKMVNILHNLSPEMLSALHGTINGSAYTMLAGLGGAMSAHSINSTNSELNQNVEIHADFPNVTDKNEIVEAFDNLVNLATQYANRKG